MKLFIKGLSELTNGEHLRMLFAPFGEVLEAKVIYDRVTRESRGFFTKETEERRAGKEGRSRRSA